MKKTNKGKKYDPPLSLYPLTMEQALNRVFRVPLKRVVELEEKEKKAEISEK